MVSLNLSLPGLEWLQGEKIRWASERSTRKCLNPNVGLGNWNIHNGNAYMQTLGSIIEGWTISLDYNLKLTVNSAEVLYKLSSLMS